MQQSRQSKSLYFYTPKQFEDNVEVLVTFSALSHGQLLALENLIDENKPGEFTYQSCILAIKTVVNNSGEPVPFSSLSPNTLLDVSNRILEMSSVPQDKLNILQKAINIKFNSQFQSETWDCVVCKSKRLDKVRNCGYRSEQDKDPNFRIHVDNQVYTSCPIYGVDTDILADAVDSYIMYDQKLLPDAGGLFDQTRFFVIASTLVTQKLRDEEIKEAKKQKRKK